MDESLRGEVNGSLDDYATGALTADELEAALRTIEATLRGSSPDPVHRLILDLHDSVDEARDLDSEDEERTVHAAAERFHLTWV